MFWRPRPGVTGLHIGQRRAQEGFVDDFAIDETTRWDADGAALLLAAWRRCEPDGADVMRVVTAHADEDKCALLAALALELAEQWWVPGGRNAWPPGRAGPSPPTGTWAVPAENGGPRGSKGGLRSSHLMVCTTTTCW